MGGTLPHEKEMRILYRKSTAKHKGTEYYENYGCIWENSINCFLGHLTAV
jgi:hypothetical protein